MAQILCDHDRKDYESNTMSFAHEIGLIKSPKNLFANNLEF